MSHPRIPSASTRRLVIIWRSKPQDVLVDLLVEILEHSKTKGNAKMTEIKIFPGLQSPWERLFSRGARYAIIQDTFWEYNESWGKAMAGIVEKKLVEWASFEDELRGKDDEEEEYGDEAQDKLAQDVKDMGLGA